METIKLSIKNIKNIVDAELDLPLDNGIYALVGINGCGKSTLMLCLAQLIRNQLDRLSFGDFSSQSSVSFEYKKSITTWTNKNNKWGGSMEIIYI